MRDVIEPRLTREVACHALMLGLLFTMVGCAARESASSMPECEPREGSLGAGATAEGLAGEYRLTLAATKGDHSGRVVDGRLTLYPQDDALRPLTMGGAAIPDVTIPLYGTTEADLEEVGALRLGDLMSLDPQQPGVAVIERHGGSEGSEFSEITIRLGSAANRRDVQAFDGGFTALYVGWLTEDGFGGGWASGVAGRESEGYFCAFRAEA